MVFRKDAKADTFQRQISALRQQLGSEEDVSPPPARPATYPSALEYAPVEASASPVSRFGSPGPAATFEPSPSPASAWPQSGTDDAASVIAPETTWIGELQASGPLHVRGRVEGAITSRSDVFVAEEAEVEATVSAENLAIAGSVRGTVRCTGRLEVLPAGRVTGDVFAPVLIVHEGATVNGQFSMTSAAAEGTVAPLRRRSGTASA